MAKLTLELCGDDGITRIDQPPDNPGLAEAGRAPRPPGD
jgi:hypothetical protein